ncbi:MULTISPECIES: SpoIIE family protein phosphatase [Streptomyces]|uniref:PAS domain S-box protein n=1 Tax=Streptomyces lasalocidi TaxID=324833 RepID=A0A4U5WKF0_STRLS|nr:MULTISPECIES: SpoIIE family protein phosphatase [Streptomyces]MCX4995705.1 PAS domain-containing SpoIIE family protein phosphatase/ATP-binding protein [Streptomyces longwoodensis]TKT02568.1 PAS domain S-box protein [Streptomyces lasalocidi]WRY90447.1 PAS domain-containing SpoIIE family protein phosphatase/ATP-binding protein [Streptomyces longwoodensis]WTI45250.1 PAS domain-containing SpoIIE family protein phosphatase/ATP-binding protein [Streptomyces longwoodensis]WUC71545.1 PAS domain-con
MSEIPAKATESEDPSGGARTEAAGAFAGAADAFAADAERGPGDGEAAPGDAMWQSSPPGSIYDYIRVASFSIGPDGLVDQWSLRAEQIFGIPAERAVGRDPIEAFVDPDLRERGQRKMAEILDGREWTGVVPFRMPEGPDGDRGQDGLAEVYVMPTRTQDGEKAAVCIVVDVRTLRSIETDLAASQAIFGQSPFGFLLIDSDLKVRRANERFASLFGGTSDDHRGKGVQDYLPRPEAERVTAVLRRVLQTGDSITDMHVTGYLPESDERRHWSINLYRVHSGSGRPIGIAWLGTDITARRAAAREAAAARRNLALLNEAGARIGNSLDLETTARELLDVVVPGFCDLATVDLYQGLLVGDETPPGLADGSAELRRVAFSSAVSDAPFASTVAPVAVGAVHHFPFNSPCADALRTARPQHIPGEEGGLVQSTLAVPMVAHDTVVGLAQFSRTKGSEPFGERDRDLAVELAARAAVCIDNARLYRREHERALILQRSLLPPGDPVASGLDIACRYLPGSASTGRPSEVGGDWFDVIELPGHRTALVVGDVMGRGLRAAVAMGELRTAVRTLALLDLEPAEVLSALDEIARGLGTPGGVQQATRAARRPREADLSEVYLATCVYAVYDSVTRRCTFANAGHLPPVLVEPGEAALMLDVPPGMPLGVGGEPFEEVEVELPEGALLALYTDGLVESRDHPLDEGLQAFVGALTDPSRPLEDVCDHVLNTLDTHHGEDDIALLMARVQGLPTDSVGDWTLPREPRSVGRAREYARGQLLSWDLEPLVDTTELLVSELVTNALRYGEGEIRLRLLLDRTLVCEVWDSGLVQPRRRRARDTDEGGRGLQLVGLLSAAWGSRRTPRGKTVWFELPLPDGETGLTDPAEALLSLF